MSMPWVTSYINPNCTMWSYWYHAIYWGQHFSSNQIPDYLGFEFAEGVGVGWGSIIWGSVTVQSFFQKHLTWQFGQIAGNCGHMGALLCLREAMQFVWSIFLINWTYCIYPFWSWSLKVIWLTVHFSIISIIFLSPCIIFFSFALVLVSTCAGL